MEQPIIDISNKKCKLCYACVRACPVKAIQVREGETFPKVIQERCIGCGSCITSCHPNAIVYRDDKPKVRELLSGNDLVIAVLSPSISAEFQDITDYRKLIQMIRSLGFGRVNAVAFAVDVLAQRYHEFIKDFKGKYYIFSNDPVVVKYVEKYKPNLVKNLAPFVSPKIVAAKIARSLYGTDCKVVYIGPEIEAKEEGELFFDDGRLDGSLTFHELRELFDENNITEGVVEYSEFDPPLGYKGSLYPIINGFIQAADMNENLLDTKVISVEGKKAMIKTLDEFETGIEVIHRHLNIMYGNSMMGPGITEGSRLIKRTNVIEFAKKRIKNFYRFEWHKNLTYYLENLELSRTFKIDDQRLDMPSEEDIERVMKQLGRTADTNVGCEDCGYTSCREFAIAVAQGITKPEMCTTYAIQNSKKFIHTISDANVKLESAQIALQESEEKVRKEKEAAQYAWDLTTAMLQKLRAGIIIANQNLKIIQSNKAFVNIMGEEVEKINEVVPGLVGADLRKLVPESIITLFSFVLKSGEEIESRDIQIGENILNMSFFPIQKNQIVGAIVRDMSTPEVQKAEVINRVTDVIDKNLNMVQKIGFLLGENAAEIEKELNSIIEFYQSHRK